VGVDRYTVGFETAASVAVGAAYAQMLAGASDPISIRSIRVTVPGGVAGGHVALSRAFAVGTGTTVHTGAAHRTLGGTAMARISSAWSQAPTGYVSRLTVDQLTVATGATRLLWSDEENGPLILEPGAALLLLNHGSGIAGGSLQVNVTWDEGRR
jgi:hypothetical protein